MLISIDFDDTFTADPKMWTEIIHLMQAHGHTVICVSARRNTMDHRIELEDALPKGVKVLLSYDEPKRDFALRNGYKVDVWIDDFPDAIVSEYRTAH